MSEQTVYRVTFADGSICHYGVESLARASARGTGKVEAITVHDAPVHPPVHLVRSVPDIDIDDRYAGRLALLLECMLIDSHGYWNEAAALLDEYKAEWDRVNPQPQPVAWFTEDHLNDKSATIRHVGLGGSK